MPRRFDPAAILRGRGARDLLISVLAAVLALAVGAVLIIVGNAEVTAALGYFFARPMDTVTASWRAVSGAYRALFEGAFGGPSQIAETLVAATPLICTGLSVTLAFRTGLFNIGAQGQLIAGALAAGWVGFAVRLPPVLHVVVAMAAGVAAGALWGGIAGILKARTGAHEVISTIMGNYVALYALTWLLTTTPLQRPGRREPISPVVHDSAQLPRFGDTRLHLGLVIALLAAVLVWWLLNRTTLGFRLRAVGANHEAARTAGMNVGGAYAMAMLLAGGLAGLAGTQMVLGTDLPLTNGIAGSFGFDGITVALLGRGNPVGTVCAALLFGALNAGGHEMQAATGIPLTLVTVLQAVTVLLVAAPALVRGIFRVRAERTEAVLAKGWN
ncbi:ABC transporter permease [Nocardia panacis]|uniref:ABC transporter permease n=1 Tax=Nocardia panacis TaxID=2340916 RepID=A0A3A4L0Q6_9NOCA|nr:ABC transporter permease [Nocardia panacis]RJO75357.1 ABC transporter permease [Nocardia panacis]